MQTSNKTFNRLYLFLAGLPLLHPMPVIYAGKGMETNMGICILIIKQEPLYKRTDLLIRVLRQLTVTVVFWKRKAKRIFNPEKFVHSLTCPAANIPAPITQPLKVRIPNNKQTTCSNNPHKFLI